MDGAATGERNPELRHVEELIEDGGEITVGPIGAVPCGASAADQHTAIAMLVRQDGETLNALLKRLDKAIGRFYDHGETIDEVNGD